MCPDAMARFKSDFITTMVERDYLHQCTDLETLDARAANGIVTAYIGFDCTAPSLHVGSLVQIMMLRQLQLCGHRPVVLMGGGTTKVGDPSGKDEQRQLLTDDEIDANMSGIKDIFSNYLRFGDGPTDAVIINNDDWLEELAYIPFLRDYGRHFSVNRMLGFDSVRLRLEREQPLSFLEFNYMILQAYDFLELYRRMNCTLQMGGSDQWGNIVSGVELARRSDGAECYGLTTPLITLASGAKMGKTAEGAMWLYSEMASPYDFWQFWRNTEDGDVGRFLRLFTELPLDEIVRLEALEGAEINEAKKVLADQATTLCHGAAAAKAAGETARQTFEEGIAGAGLPTFEISRTELEDGKPVFQLLVEAEVSASNSEARRLIKGGGCRVNDVPVKGELDVVSLADLDDQGRIKLSAGRKRHALIIPV